MPRIVFPLNKLCNLDVPPYHPVFEEGVVFHAYSNDYCKSSNQYLDNLELNIDAILRMEKTVKDYSYLLFLSRRILL